VRLPGRRPSRDEELRRVYREHVRAVYAFLAYSVPSATAEDLTAGTFERVIRAWGRFDPARASERTWILAIARNLLADHFRRQQHRAAVSLDEHPGLLDAVQGGSDWEARRLSEDELRGWLGQLKPREQQVLALRYGADLPAEDVAHLLELTAANVHQIASRALRRLRELAGDARP
jgi:RNA polymerase sigma-70 factor (ECF subfamily)